MIDEMFSPKTSDSWARKGYKVEIFHSSPLKICHPKRKPDQVPSIIFQGRTGLRLGTESLVFHTQTVSFGRESQMILWVILYQVPLFSLILVNKQTNLIAAPCFFCSKVFFLLV